MKIIVIGGQWGDEGKGKIVDYLARRLAPDVGVRFNGGPNAGHSLDNEFGQIVLHQIPATIFQKNSLSLLANGVVIDPEELLSEISLLENLGVDISGLRISKRAHLIMPWHKERDKLEEKSRGSKKIGTTGRGIGPCYADKAARNGIQVADISSPGLGEKVSRLYWENKRRFAIEGFLAPPEAILKVLDQFRAKTIGSVVDSEIFLWQQEQAGKKILFEGAQGTLLDLDFGSYPMVTSSATTRLGVYQGSGLPPGNNEVVLGVFKGYATRVGEGPFPTEMLGKEGEEIRVQGKEFGATTGRPRRCGWFDSVLARYTARLNGFTGLVLTKSDVLDSKESLSICIGYELDGRKVFSPPATVEELERCQPIFDEVKGWQKPTSAIRKFEDLPEEFQDYVRRIEELVEVPVVLISNGPRTEETIEVKPFLF